MTRRTIAALATATFALLGCLLGPTEVYAQANADYTAQPPFLDTVAQPNILFIADMTSTMKDREYSGVAFTASTTFSGLFDPMKCYDYDSGDGRFEPASPAKASISATCPGKWDGNFLNWIALRRSDAAKKAMTGGTCVKVTGGAPRDADGNCLSSGSPSLPTIAHQTLFTGSGNDKATGAVPSATYTGRVGLASAPANLYFYVMGTGSLAGYLCVDDDATAPGSTTCSDADAYAEGQFRLRVALESAPRGVLQDFSGRARFGLMQFSGTASTDIEVLVPVGSRQALDYTATFIETFNTNTVAMVDAVDELFHKGQTPIAEAMYEAIRYFAQLPSAYNTTGYAIPQAYSPAVALAQNGAGSLGSGGGGAGTPEESVLTGTETCPAGYIANACGRDPYFFGSKHSPAWASPSAPVTCCKSFVILFSDGRADMNVDLPANAQGLKEIAAYHPYHGTHCTGSNTADPPSPLTTCSQASTLDGAEVLSQHKADRNLGHWMDELAYWAHTTDLRQATIPVINEAGHDLAGFQNLTFYVFQAAKDPIGRDFLRHVAVAGGFEDVNGNNLPDNGLTPAAPCSTTDLTQPCEWDKVVSATGAAGRDNIPDAYFEAESVDELQDKLTATINAILQRSASGTSLSVLATSSTGEGAAYQAYFYPHLVEGFNQVDWVGYLQSLFVDAFGNTREDTDQDGRLVLKNDKIVVNRYDSVKQVVRVDKYVDLNEDGKADDLNSDTVINASDCSPCDKPLSDIVAIWEAGKQLALMAESARKILTWVDTNNNGLVESGEQIPFTAANATTLGPYLRAGAAPYTATNIINFIRGVDPQVAGLRDRLLQVPPGSGTQKVWKLGDLIHSTPVVVGAPKERYDVLYGDATYTAYFQQYKSRRQVAYAGANDGMLHAFNIGYFHRGDDPSTSASSKVEHGWFTRTATDNSSGPLLGDELWGFIPYELLPQLQWLTRTDYMHVYYVDLKPKVTDARIFTPDADHPGGWGTILIGGFRMGGSCKACTAGTGAPEMKVNIGGTDRYFYSAYFVLDVTNPEADPKLLWSFSYQDLGLTTSYPAVVRVNPSGSAKTDNTNAKWFLVAGSGPTGYGGASSQESKFYAVDLKTGPKDVSGSNLFTELKRGDAKAFMGDLISLDANLDYRTDVVYGGSVIDQGTTPPWEGKLLRLTIGTTAPFGGATTPSLWGKSQKPTDLLDSFSCTPSPCTGPTNVGPVAAAPTVTADDASKIWVFFGTGRYYTPNDKTNADTQHFFGVKDPVLTGACTQTSETNCRRNDLVNVSAATVCVVGTGDCGQSGGTNQVTGVSGVSGDLNFSGSSTSTLEGLVQSKDGWFTTLPEARERSLVSPTLIGGVVFFPTFVPLDDICAASGSGFLYALFYKTGSAYKESVIGTETSGINTNVSRRITLSSAGLASQMAIHIGGQGSGDSGTSGTGTGCAGQVTGFIQSSTGMLSQLCTKPPGQVWSRYISWINQRM